jgi:hypothetical protein
MTIIWFNDPSILFNKNDILEIWPSNKMTFEQKLNAISRLVIVLTILGLLITRKISILIIGLLTLTIVFSIYKFRKQRLVVNEGFENNSSSFNNPKQLNPESLKTVLKNNFYPTSIKNPFGNVLLTEIMDDPNRPSASPSFNPEVYNDIDIATKKQTQMLYPGIINTNKQLYGDLYDNYQFDTGMMQRFYSTANTRVDNDQGALAQWLYSDYPSGKADGVEGAFARTRDNYRYILI